MGYSFIPHTLANCGRVSQVERQVEELFFNGKSERELAAECGIPRMTLCSRKLKIMNKLKTLLKK
jgi:DNA-directed RNA polymerase specialized sigma subunit